MKKKRILITGGCGFIGSHLAVDLTCQGFEVTALDNLSRRGSEILLQQRVNACGAGFIRGDVRIPEDLRKVPGRYDLLIECSAEPSVLMGTKGEDARYLLDVNLQGAINCFEWARERRTPVIFLSTSRVYPYDKINACRYQETETRYELLEGCPGVHPDGVSAEMPLQGVRSLYGASKLGAELILQEYAFQYKLPAIIDRCGVVAGPWQLGKADQGVFAFWMAKHYFRGPLNYIGFGGTGKQVRDLLHVQDLADLIGTQARILMNGAAPFYGEVFNAGGSRFSNLSLFEATNLCARLTGNAVAVGSIPECRPADMIWYLTDNGNTGEIFDWKPRRAVKEIFEDIFLWMRENEAEARKIFL
ncbi:MAG: CDP-paratose 2-epimerase [Candidatus Omnitrophica bacterium ADurb.Bin277]|nr:MAG: CDP-paratose 2-epimerase [Candidatus Omnitrophica bacterium ADurb.Bin277]